MRRKGGRFWVTKSSQAMYSSGGSDPFLGKGSVMTMSDDWGRFDETVSTEIYG
jgi:hypothetical protein